MNVQLYFLDSHEYVFCSHLSEFRTYTIQSDKMGEKAQYDMLHDEVRFSVKSLRKPLQFTD